jgi:hypothetical protein
MKLARLTVEAIFINSSRIADTYTCSEPQMSSRDGKAYETEISRVYGGPDKPFKCREYQFLPPNAIHDLVGDNLSLRVLVLFGDTNTPNLEYPILKLNRGANNDYNLDITQAQKIVKVIPTLSYNNIVVEYSSSDRTTSSAPEK